MAMPMRLFRPPPVQSQCHRKVIRLRAELWAQRLAHSPVHRASRIFAPGWCAMLIAAVAVSVGFVPVAVPSAVAVASSVLHEDAVFTQLARIFASVLISVCGTVPLPAGVVASAVPFNRLTRFAALANALAIPTCASAVPELDTCVASVANPAKEYAAAMVVTSFTVAENRRTPTRGAAPNRRHQPRRSIPPAQRIQIELLSAAAGVVARQAESSTRPGRHIRAHRVRSPRLRRAQQRHRRIAARRRDARATIARRVRRKQVHMRAHNRRRPAIHQPSQRHIRQRSHSNRRLARRRPVRLLVFVTVSETVYVPAAA